MGRKAYKVVRFTGEFHARLRALRDYAAKQLGIAGYTLEDTIKAILHDAQVWYDGAHELQEMHDAAAAEFAEVSNALLTCIAMDVAARREAMRRLDAGEDDPYDVDHVAHWRELNAEQKAGDLAVARVRVEATTGVNPLAPMKSLAQAEAWMADNPPKGLAVDNAHANRRMTAQAQRMAQQPPAAPDAAAKRSQAH